MPKITKLYVERGKTVQVDDKTWDKQSFGIEADVSDVAKESDIDELWVKLTMKCEDQLQEGAATVTKPTVPEAPIKAEDIPDIDIGEINDCVWIRYGKNKGPAKPGQAAWTKSPIQFTSETFPKALSQLVKLIKKTPDGKLVIGDLEYSLSGGDSGEHFIGRKPCKPEKATESRKSKTSSKIENVKALFSKDLEDMLTFEETGEFIVIKPRQFLGSENFSKIAAVVRQANGEYISAGKQSHFRVPVK